MRNIKNREPKLCIPRIDTVPVSRCAVKTYYPLIVYSVMVFEIFNGCLIKLFDNELYLNGFKGIFYLWH